MRKVILMNITKESKSIWVGNVILIKGEFMDYKQMSQEQLEEKLTHLRQIQLGFAHNNEGLHESDIEDLIEQLCEELEKYDGGLANES
jgi:uncharacterized iron-regulated protein